MCDSRIHTLTIQGVSQIYNQTSPMSWKYLKTKKSPLHFVSKSIFLLLTPTAVFWCQQTRWISLVQPFWVTLYTALYGFNVFYVRHSTRWNFCYKYYSSLNTITSSAIFKKYAEKCCSYNNKMYSFFTLIYWQCLICGFVFCCV